MRTEIVLCQPNLYSLGETCGQRLQKHGVLLLGSSFIDLSQPLARQRLYSCQEGTEAIFHIRVMLLCNLS